MSSTVFPEFLAGRSALGLLFVRIVTGAAFMLHGWPKIQNPFGWMGPTSPVPGIFQALAALSEFGGGLALILGLLTPLACLGLACTMVVAIGMVHLPAGDPFVAMGGKRSFELALVYLANVVMLLLAGPGVFSLDEVLFGRRGPEARSRSMQQVGPLARVG
ncbi:MAG: DoxX family protein [Candidatus Riflebacteria bacterium]|nr:DoxX family protein [Candidatus Riflebacteria bacterium]